MTKSEKKDTVENIYEQPISAEMLLRGHTRTEETIDVKSSLLKMKMDNFIFNEDSGSEMCHKTTREFMQKLRAVVKF